MKTISATKSKAGAYKGKSHRASPGKMMGQHEQGLGLPVQDGLFVVELGGLMAKLWVPFLSLASIVTGSRLLTLTSFLGSSCSGSFLRGSHCLLVIPFGLCVLWWASPVCTL